MSSRSGTYRVDSLLRDQEKKKKKKKKKKGALVDVGRLGLEMRMPPSAVAASPNRD